MAADGDDLTGGTQTSGEVPVTLGRGDVGGMLEMPHRLATCHQQHGACGNLRASSQGRRDGRLRLKCHVERPSRCEQTRDTGPKNRIDLHSGRPPEPADDLTTPGVLLGECRVPVNRRPPVGQPSTYRRELAARLSNKRWTVTKLDCLIGVLLRVEADTHSVGQFLRWHSPLIHFDSAGHRWPDRLANQSLAADRARSCKGRRTIQRRR